MVFDTNVLVYSVHEQSEFYQPCFQRLQEARTGRTPAFLTWNICCEFLRVTTHPQVLPNHWSIAEGWDFIAGLLESPGFDLLLPTPNHLSELYRVTAELPDIRGNPVHDMHTAVLMREHNIREICTLDGDFRQFPFLEIINPLE